MRARLDVFSIFESQRTVSDDVATTHRHIEDVCSGAAHEPRIEPHRRTVRSSLQRHADDHLVFSRVDTEGISADLGTGGQERVREALPGGNEDASALEPEPLVIFE